MRLVGHRVGWAARMSSISRPDVAFEQQPAGRRTCGTPVSRRGTRNSRRSDRTAAFRRSWPDAGRDPARIGLAQAADRALGNARHRVLGDQPVAGRFAEEHRRAGVLATKCRDRRVAEDQLRHGASGVKQPPRSGQDEDLEPFCPRGTSATTNSRSPRAQPGGLDDAGLSCPLRRPVAECGRGRSCRRRVAAIEDEGPAGGLPERGRSEQARDVCRADRRNAARRPDGGAGVRAEGDQHGDDGAATARMAFSRSADPGRVAS